MSKAVIVGSGPTKVIVLHGWFGSASAWRPFAEAVDPENFTYAFMDYRGYGTRIQEAGVYSIEEIAADALALADSLGWERFSLVGHSMGGKAVQRVLSLAPSRVEKIVAVTPVPASGVPFDDGTWAFFSAAKDDINVRQAIIDNTTGCRQSKAWVKKLARHSWEHSTPFAFSTYLQAWAKGDFSKEIQGNPVPLKVIVGEHDPALTADVMKHTFLQWYPNARLEVLPEAGHYPMDETPVALATSVERFLSGQE